MKGVLRARARIPGAAHRKGGVAAMRPPFFHFSSFQRGARMVPRRLAAAVIEIIHGSSKSDEYVRKTLDNG